MRRSRSRAARTRRRLLIWVRGAAVLRRSAARARPAHVSRRAARRPGSSRKPSSAIWKAGRRPPALQPAAAWAGRRGAPSMKACKTLSGVLHRDACTPPRGGMATPQAMACCVQPSAPRSVSSSQLMACARARQTGPRTRPGRRRTQEDGGRLLRARSTLFRRCHRLLVVAHVAGATGEQRTFLWQRARQPWRLSVSAAPRAPQLCPRRCVGRTPRRAQPRRHKRAGSADGRRVSIARHRPTTHVHAVQKRRRPTGRQLTHQPPPASRRGRSAGPAPVTMQHARPVCPSSNTTRRSVDASAASPLPPPTVAAGTWCVRPLPTCRWAEA